MYDLLVNQLSFFGTLTQTEKDILYACIQPAKEAVEKTQDRIIPARRTKDYFNSHYSMMFLYRLARIIHDNHPGAEAGKPVSEKLFLLNRMLNAIDLYYKINMPEHFLIGHGLGTVFSQAKYGNYLVVYQNVTVGVQEGAYPVIGDNVVIYPNSMVMGKTILGDHSVVGSGTTLINKAIPANCVVFQKDGQLVIRENTNKEITKYFQD